MRVMLGTSVALLAGHEHNSQFGGLGTFRGDAYGDARW
jgi:hypothetical protein